ncbi:MAG: hypothetical protein D6706_07825 [Chloroflexi bacterium]|nr:MAG: hypothetical protein D6706_07825 [Chloroflexota bacterium]
MHNWDEVISHINEQFADSRTQLCQLTTAESPDGTVWLSGVVLDEETKTAVLSQLHQQFPQTTFNTKSLRVLRQSPSLWLTVQTSITGLYAEPSFLAEQVSQVLLGWQLELLREEGKWAFVRLAEGYLGWVYRPYLGNDAPSEPTHLVTEPVALLRTAPATDASLAGRILAGTAVAISEQHQTWAALTLPGGLSGWISAASLRPLTHLPTTENGRRQQLIADASQFIGVPYLWGGCSALGIDCSGYSQLLHRLVGCQIPRDADMQFAAGQPVEPPFRAGDLLFFGREGDHRAISHVGVSLGGWRMIHASRARNGVFVDDVSAVNWLMAMFVGGRTFLG